jgi:hypothetical protein
MTGAVERHCSSRRVVKWRRRMHRSWRLIGLIATSLALASACTADVPDSGGTPQPSTELAAASDVPVADAQSIRVTMQALNSSAAGGVAEQQATLATVVEPALAKALDDCAPATTTLRFEPVYRGLRPAPGWTGTSGSLTGTVYALPTLIRVFTGDRITGTDLTTLHFGVQAGEAFITPLCAG